MNNIYPTVNQEILEDRSTLLKSNVPIIRCEKGFYALYLSEMKKQVISFTEKDLIAFNTECLKAINFLKISNLKSELLVYVSESIEDVSEYLESLLRVDKLSSKLKNLTEKDKELFIKSTRFQLPINCPNLEELRIGVSFEELTTEEEIESTLINKLGEYVLNTSIKKDESHRVFSDKEIKNGARYFEVRFKYASLDLKKIVNKDYLKNKNE